VNARVGGTASHTLHATCHESTFVLCVFQFISPVEDQQRVNHGWHFEKQEYARLFEICTFKMFRNNTPPILMVMPHSDVLVNR
jgi:hypothetical protein